ncbi:hypothetical protein Y032_0252g201 [Ancylostoma ceylanicum]|uniref:Uncharacterized protein n=1 Tax=Ancylostoma ceylanicum TaxID=53326 RepID=A0A016SBP5_9BILA|nr:hypothetical protein Y032_0252g201 [Ancylostoma ceylanicum]
MSTSVQQNLPFLPQQPLQRQPRETEPEAQPYDVAKKVIIGVAAAFMVVCTLAIVCGLAIENKKRKRKLALLRSIEMKERQKKKMRKMKKRKKKAKKKLDQSKKRMKKQNKELKQVLEEYLAGQTETYASYYDEGETNVEVPAASSSTGKESSEKKGSASASRSSSKTPAPRHRTPAQEPSLPDENAQPPLAGDTPHESPVPEIGETPPPEAADPLRPVAVPPPHDDTYEQVDLGGVEQPPEKK